MIPTFIDEEVCEVLGRPHSVPPVGNGADLLLLPPLEDVLLGVELHAVNGPAAMQKLKTLHVSR